MPGPRDESKFGTGHDDGLTPLAPLDPNQATSVDALVRAMAKTAFGGRRLGEAADVLEEMVRDRDCFRVVTVSGAMTVAKQGLLLCEMIERGCLRRRHDRVAHDRPSRHRTTRREPLKARPRGRPEKGHGARSFFR